MTRIYSETCTHLEIFRLDKNMSYRRLAMYLDADHTLIYRFCRCQRYPNEYWRNYIEEKTKGKVKASKWKNYDKRAE